MCVVKCDFTKLPLPQILFSVERVKAGYLSGDISLISARGLVWVAASDHGWRRVTLLGCSHAQTLLCLCSCSLLPLLPGLWECSQPAVCIGWRALIREVEVGDYPVS